jgi:hypothetical protein
VTADRAENEQTRDEPEGVDLPPTELVTVETGDATARRLTRTEVATLMGVSPSTVVRRERAGLLRAEVVDGVHVFDETEVKQTITTLRHRTAITALGERPGTSPRSSSRSWMQERRRSKL